MPCIILKIEGPFAPFSKQFPLAFAKAAFHEKGANCSILSHPNLNNVNELTSATV